MNIYGTCIKEDIEKKQDKQNPPARKENGGRNLAIILCYFLTLAEVFSSKFRLQYKAQPFLSCYLKKKTARAFQKYSVKYEIGALILFRDI